jgi:putative spermidine/putrescine transport system ATP-binding protein
VREPGGTAEAAIRLTGLRKRFGEVTAVDGVDLDIAPGEFFSMLGPSGSGKTTVLRLIAGFERPTDGRVLLGGADVTDRPPFARDVNTVFQDYALFPHMDVLTNVEYGLRVKKVGRPERRERALQALEAVRLGGFGDRRPHQLSGGQRQRVALARALVNRPTVLLLDEPLGALDLKLRREMQVELKHIQRDVAITFVFVTHDQEEALTMSDRIAVFDAGRIEQVATPRELYERPATPFVAGFVGTGNLLRGAAATRLLGSEGPFSIRPEKIALRQAAAARNGAGNAAGKGSVTVSGRIVDVLYLGSSTHTVVDIGDGTRLSALEPNRGARWEAGRPGDQVLLTWDRAHVVALGDAGAATSADRAAPVAGHQQDMR